MTTKRTSPGLITDLLDNLKYGDSPAPVRAERGSREGCNTWDGGFVCTRFLGHPGKHIAGGTSRIVHTWPNDRYIQFIIQGM